MNDGNHIPEEDLALYAMGSLDATESSAVEAHLGECAVCREALSEVAGDLVLVGLAAEQQALPAGGRERFVQRIAAHSTGAVSDRESAGFTEPAAMGVGATGAAVRGGGVAVPLPFIAPARVQSRTRPLLIAIPWLLAAAMLAAAVYLGSEISDLRSSRDEARSQTVRLAGQAARAQEVLEVLTAPGAQHVTLTEGKPAPAPTAHTSYLPSRGALVFVASNLHPLPASQAYELWLIPANGKAPMPAGTFRPDERGMASLVLPPLPKGIAAKAFGVTIERAEGSPTPTLPIILSGS